MPVRSTRVIVRVVKSPKEQRGQILIVLPESRSFSGKEVLIFALERETYLVEDLRRVMDRTRAADPHTAAESRRQFEYIYGEPVVLSVKANAGHAGTDQSPAAEAPFADEPPADRDAEDDDDW